MAIDGTETDRENAAMQAAADAQHLAEAHYRELIDHIPAGVVVHNAASEIVLANPVAARLLGLDFEQLKGRTANDARWHFQHRDGTAFQLSDYPVNRVLESKAAVQDVLIGIRHRERDPLVWVLCNAFPVLSASGELTAVVVSFTDVTSLQRAQQELQLSEERLRLVVRGSNDAPWDWDLKTDQIYYSPRWWEMLGYAVDALPSDTQLWTSLLHPEDRERVQNFFSTILGSAADDYEVEFRLLHNRGNYVHVLSRGFILRDAVGRPVRVSGTNADLSDRKLAEEQIFHLAFYDALTDLPNRRHLLEKFRKALLTSSRTGQHGALLFIDLDRFKELNDTLGHDTGDELLKQVAQRLRVCVRASDMVARLGGDEFVVILEALSQDKANAAIEAEKIGQKIIESLNREYQISIRPYHGTLSIGVVLFDATSEGIEAALKQADLALYQAKAAGRNMMRFFDASMQEAVYRRVGLEADLRDGMKRQQMLLHYQPQLNTFNGVVGAEVLLRWLHPDRGLSEPATFMPLAETTGLVLPLSRWVLRRTCEQLALWARDPLFSHLTLAVNISTQQFKAPGFFDELLAILEETSANPRRLKLELTESALADDLDEVVRTMEALRMLGVVLALDDFGTGYSSLGYLKQLPLDELKIARSFVTDLLTDPGNAAIARIVITLAREFGLTVLADGVERAEQRDFLARQGCHTCQGALYAGPAPIDVFEAWIRAHKKT